MAQFSFGSTLSAAAGTALRWLPSRRFAPRIGLRWLAQLVAACVIGACAAGMVMHARGFRLPQLHGWYFASQVKFWATIEPGREIPSAAQAPDLRGFSEPVPTDHALRYAVLLVSLALAGLAWSRTSGRRVLLPHWCAPQMLGLLIGTGVTLSAFNLWGFYIPSLTPLVGSNVAAGERPMVLQADGWLNGRPPPWSDLKGRVVIVDVWADW